MNDAVYVATNDPNLAETLHEALRRSGEMTILQRLTRSAGRRDWFLIESASDITAVLGEGRPHDAFSFFITRQFDARGRLDEELIERLRAILSTMPLNTDELLVAQRVSGQIRLQDCEGFSSNQIEEFLDWAKGHVGADVVAGQHPPLLSNNADEVVTAIVPDQEGKVQLGVY
jgi:hypothetical protein